MKSSNLSRFILFISLIILFQTGCGTVRITFEDFQPVDLPDSDLASFSEQYLRRNTTVIVAPFDTQGIQPADIISKSNLATTITGALEKYLSQAGVQIYDGNESKKRYLIDAARKNEILLDRQSGQIIVDYVIFSRLNSFDVYSEYMSAYESKSFFTGNITQYPPECKYTINFFGTIRIYDGLTRRIVKSLGVRKEEKYSIITQGQCNNMCDFVISMSRKNAEEAIQKARLDIQYFFSPNAYVRQMRKHKENNSYIVSITCGNKRLLTNNAQVSFYSPVKTQGTSTIHYEEKKGTGKLTNYIDDDIAWVMLDDPGIASRIRRGDLAKVKYNKSYLTILKHKLME
jgi:hypothetical protein